MTRKVAARTLAGFLGRATRMGECLRCGRRFESEDEWATLAQIRKTDGGEKIVAVGGMLCEACISSFKRWESS